MATGPQKYPGASLAHWYQDDFGGDLMEVNVVCLHTTEGRTLPDYDGGALAPNLTAVPDLAAKKLRWFQHFDIDRSSRALQNLRGGVETNTLNVVQVELVGTCDPKTHANWGSAQHVYWPEAPDWALDELAVFLRWLHAEHGVPLAGPTRWPAYPSSYANGGGQRMSGSQWEAFNGVCGHMHVPENVHGDPGAINFPKLIALTKGSTVPEEDDMPTAAEIADAVVKRLQDTDGTYDAPADAPDYDPDDSKAGHYWTGRTLHRDLITRVRRTDKAVAGLAVTLNGVALALSKIDPATLAAAVAAEFDGYELTLVKKES